MQETKWEIDGKLVWRTERVAAIRGAIEAELHEDLTRMQLAQMADGRSWERPASRIHAVVVSLSPDIAIASVGHFPVDSTTGPFDEWPGARLLSTVPEKAFGAEYINCFNGNLAMSAGPIAPFTEEMYVIAGDRNVPAQRIRFENDEAEVTVQNAVVKLRHEGDTVRIDVDYR